MQKNSTKSIWNVKNLVFMALLVAMQLVLTRVLVLDLGPYRITVGTVCTVLAGLWMGPVAGGVCGLCADIVGCFLKGYAVNPFITLASILWGVLPALFRKFYLSKSRKAKTVGISVSIVITGVISSLCLTTAGLAIMLGYNFYAIMPGRLVCNYDSDLLCTDLPSVFQSSDLYGGRAQLFRCTGKENSIRYAGEIF